jgi:hypothetical protein
VRAPVGPCTSEEPLGSARGDPRPAGRGNRRAGDWCSGGGGLRAAGRLVDDGGAVGNHQGVHTNSMAALARLVLARGALTACDHGTGATAALRHVGRLGEGHQRVGPS